MNEMDSEDQFGRPEFSRVMGWITPLLATAIGGSVWPPPSGSGTPPFDTAGVIASPPPEEPAPPPRSSGPIAGDDGVRREAPGRPRRGAPPRSPGLGPEPGRRDPPPEPLSREGQRLRDGDRRLREPDRRLADQRGGRGVFSRSDPGWPDRRGLNCRRAALERSRRIARLKDLFQ